MADAREETMKNGRKAASGKCPDCGALLFKIIGGKLAEGASESRVDEVEADPCSDPCCDLASSAEHNALSKLDDDACCSPRPESNGSMARDKGESKVPEPKKK